MPDGPILFKDVLEAESQEIRDRRLHLLTPAAHEIIEASASTISQGPDAACQDQNWCRAADARDRMGKEPIPTGLVGLALSGGGIRSATFCLGVLQALCDLRLLFIFDYLSTVSGGGFIGGWWSAWMGRTSRSVQVSLEPYDTLDYNTLSLALAQFHYLSLDASGMTLCCDRRVSEADEIALSAALEPSLQQYIEWRSGHAATPSEQTAGLTPDRKPVADAERKLKRWTKAEEQWKSVVDLLVEQSCSNIPQRGSDCVFPPPERIEPERAQRYVYESVPGHGLEEREELAESAMLAGDDPVHHLRLYGNYLTPRKGLTSKDTWRAVLVVTRNLVMTWLVLLPLIFATVAAVRIYFVWEPLLPQAIAEPEWAGPHTVEIPTNALYRARLQIRRSLETAPQEKPTSAQLIAAKKWETLYWQIMLRRFAFAVRPLLPILGWIIVLSIAWLSCQRDKRTFRDILMGLAGFMALIALIGLVLQFAEIPLGQSAMHPRWEILAWILFAAVLCLWGAWPLPGMQRHLPLLAKNDVRRNRIIRIQTLLLMGMVFFGVCLMATGFSYELIVYFWTAYANPYVETAGWLAVLSAIGGAIYTGLTASPVGGADKNEAVVRPTPISRIIYAVAPPLVLLLLIAAAAAIVQRFAFYVEHRMSYGEHHSLHLPPLFRLTIAAGVGMFLCILLASSEMLWGDDRGDEEKRPVWLVVICLLLTSVYLLSVTWMAWTLNGAAFTAYPNHAGIAVVAGLGLVVANLLISWAQRRTGDASAAIRALASLGGPRRTWFAIFVFAGLMLAAILFVNSRGAPAIPLPHSPTDHAVVGAALSLMPWLGSVLCMIVLLFQALFGAEHNWRALWLVAFVEVLLLAFLLVAWRGYLDPISTPDSRSRAVLTYALLDVVTVAVSFVVAMGWTADPNSLSMHEFYKARLVRAYLGASNPRRELRHGEITDAIEGDDLRMADLQNCQRGGPYHLINTTLNLVGGRDLATAQRSSANFLMSKCYCGSVRTAYRPTDDYMGGRLTLGTAVAISGAAASPNMGDKTPSAALAALMTLLNVRLGYWAPTPNRGRWKSSQARLWPFYAIREFLSNTNDLSSYCYLTDGGHFDNTGVYALVQRGCRYIIVADCGADPSPPAFEDLGAMVRRCRIDFGAEIDLDLSPLMAKPPEGGPERVRGPCARRYISGTILYSVEHAESLGWPEYESQAARTGRILWLKPSLTSHESGDVRQYGFSHDIFPQQATADQWFDEAQFESYRKLGETTVHEAFEGLSVVQAALRAEQRGATDEECRLTPAEAELIFAELARCSTI